MRLPALVLTALLTMITLTSVVRADDAAPPRPLALISLLPPAPGPHPDLDEFILLFWVKYYNAPGELGFTLNQVRVSRVALKDDDDTQLILMIDHPGWRTVDGKPFVIATWRDGQWAAIGWGWGDEDGLFETTEIVGGWHSLDAGKYTMRWDGQQYQTVPK